jgi:vacuolar-type H+-ATPase subunit E/Vma4
MAIEDIFRALEEQADAECSEILRVAEAQAASLKEEARREADRIKAQKLAVVEDVVKAKAGKTLNAARLEKRKALAAVRDRAVDGVFDDALVKLGKMRGTGEYERVFAALAGEALGGMTGECEILVDPADIALAEKASASLGVGCTVKAGASTKGGLVATMHGGRITRRNTFESRLAKVRTLAQARVAEILNQ